MAPRPVRQSDIETLRRTGYGPAMPMTDAELDAKAVALMSKAERQSQLQARRRQYNVAEYVQRRAVTEVYHTEDLLASLDDSDARKAFYEEVRDLQQQQVTALNEKVRALNWEIKTLAFC